MKFYISSDMEGVAGVCAWEQVDARTPHPRLCNLSPVLYARGSKRDRRRARGRRGGGARQRLPRPDAQPPARRPSERRSRPLRQSQTFLDGTGRRWRFRRRVFRRLSWRLRATPTPSSATRTRRRSSTRFALNGVRCSEATINAALLGCYGVPVLLVTGDRTTVEGVREQMPWVRGVVVKDSIGNFRRELDDPGRRMPRHSHRGRRGDSGCGGGEAVSLRTADRSRRGARHRSAGTSRRDDPRLRAHRRPQRPLRTRSFPVVFKAFVATWRLGAQA